MWVHWSDHGDPLVPASVPTMQPSMKPKWAEIADIVFGKSKTEARHLLANMPVNERTLWVSNENDELGWLKWCHNEEAFLDKLTYCRNVVLHEDAGLHLNTISCLQEFDSKYGVLLLDNGSSLGHSLLWAEGDRKYAWRDHQYHSIIDWERVRQDGHCYVAIPHYLSPIRLDCPWYHSWDCASAVIWDHAGIKSISDPVRVNPDEHLCC